MSQTPTPPTTDTSPTTPNKSTKPLIALDPHGTPAVLSYNLPDPTSYRGRHIIELDIPESYFVAAAAADVSKQTTTTSTNTTAPAAQAGAPMFAGIMPGDDVYQGPVARTDTPDEAAIKTAIKQAKETGYFEPTIFPNVSGGNDPLSRTGMREVMKTLDEDTIVTQLLAGNRLTIYRSSTGEYDYRFIGSPRKSVPRLLLVEHYRLSSFLGRYGVGRTLKTFSLLPGERTKITITSYRSSQTTLQQAASILDSTTDETEREFERTVLQEQTKQENVDKSLEYHAEAEAEGKASWGWGSASINASGGVKGSTNAVREEFGKNMANAVAHNAAKASTRRDVQIDTTAERTSETRDETGVERELANINVSRTLNFVFKQMNQEYITLLHLVDVRVAFFNGYQESRQEVPLTELGGLLAQYVKANRRSEVQGAIRTALASIVDYQGRETPGLVQDVERHHQLSYKTGAGTYSMQDYTEYYTTVSPSYNSEYPVTDDYRLTVPGVIIAADRHVLRTDGVVVDAFLGQGDCLDAYSHGLQDQAVRERELENERRMADISTLREESQARQSQMSRDPAPLQQAQARAAEQIANLAIDIVQSQDAGRAEIFQRVFPAATWWDGTRPGQPAATGQTIAPTKPSLPVDGGGKTPA